GRVMAGEDFGDLAAEFSEDAATAKNGGRLGILKRGELAADIEKAILRLSPGEHSAPFRSEVGYHLFELDSKETLAGEQLAQARNQIATSCTAKSTTSVSRNGWWKFAARPSLR